MFKILSPACVFPMCRLSGDGRSVVLRRLNRIIWMVGFLSVVVSSYMASLPLGNASAEYLKLLFLVVVNLILCFGMRGIIAFCWNYAKPLTFEPNLLSLDSRKLAVDLLP